MKISMIGGIRVSIFSKTTEKCVYITVPETRPVGNEGLVNDYNPLCVWTQGSSEKDMYP